MIAGCQTFDMYASIFFILDYEKTNVCSGIDALLWFTLPSKQQITSETRFTCSLNVSDSENVSFMWPVFFRSFFLLLGLVKGML